MSFHFVSCFGAMTMSYFIGIGSSPFFAVSVALFAAAMIGLVNGYLIGKFNLPDMVTSIGLGSAMYGFAYIYSGGRYIYRNFMDSGIMLIGDYQLFDVIPLPCHYYDVPFLVFLDIDAQDNLWQKLFCGRGKRDSREVFRHQRHFVYCGRIHYLRDVL